METLKNRIKNPVKNQFFGPQRKATNLEKPKGNLPKEPPLLVEGLYHGTKRDF